MIHRTFLLLGIIFLWAAYKHQQLDRLVHTISPPPKEIKNPTIEGLKSFQTTQAESLEKIKDLIEAGSIHNRNQFGASPLLLAACQTGDPNVVEFLYSQGARLQDKDNYGNTALMCAAEAGNLRLVNWLLDRGVRVDQRNRLGQTALYFAAREGKYQTVKTLLNKGAKVLMKDFLGRTPQQVAKRNRHMRVSKLLQPKSSKTRMRAVY